MISGRIENVSRRQMLRRLAGGAMFMAAAPAFAQGSVFPPPVKLDVPYVPTPQDVVDRMLDLVKVRSDDFVMDLGCGDGRMLVTAAAKFGARGYGVDINPVRIEEANANARKAGVAEKVQFEIKDLFKTPIEKASVIAMYLLPSVMLQLRPRILSDMKPGSRLVSHDFHMDDWEPDYQESLSDHDVFYWIVPARAEGMWNLDVGGESYSLSIRQKFQKVEGRIATDKLGGVIREGRIEGDRIRFNAVFDDGRTLVFNGRISNNRLVVDKASPPQIVPDWSATRVH